MRKIAGVSSSCSEDNMLVLYQSSQGYTLYLKIRPQPLMTALEHQNTLIKNNVVTETSLRGMADSQF